MTHSTNQGPVNQQRRQQVLSLAKVAAGVAGWSVGRAWAAKKSKQAPAPAAALAVVKPEKRNIAVAITNPSALPFLPLLVAQQKGFFEQQGIDLVISEQQSAARATSAVASGGADIVCGLLENMLAAPGRALALQSFVLLGISPMMALGVPKRTTHSASPASSVPTEMAQLKGRKIGVVALNSPTHTVALAAVRRAGLRPGDVAFVSVGSPTSATAALRSGQIDALIHMDPLMLELEQRDEIKLLADMRSPADTMQALGMHLPSSCVAAPAEFLQRYPGTAQACSDALVQALEWLAQASLRDMLQLLPEKASSMENAGSAPMVNAQLFVASMKRLRNAYSSDGVCTPPLASNLLQAMMDAEPTLRLEQIDASLSVNNVFALRGATRLKR